MVKPARGMVVVVVFLALASCNDLMGIHEAILDPCAVDPNDELCDGAGGAGAGASTGSMGGAAPFCGDGKIDPGEECDDQNDIPDDGCTKCAVDCAGPTAIKSPKTHHCYRFFKNAAQTWEKAGALCSALGGYLVTVTSAEELALVGLIVTSEVWAGGNDIDQEQSFVWSNGEPWGDFAPWKSSEPPLDTAKNCLKLTGQPLSTFDDENCLAQRLFVCELEPVGALP